MPDPATLIPGTLDLMILRAVSLGKLHGYGVLVRIQQASGGSLQIKQGALYPALYRLHHQGFLRTEWGKSENGRAAKFYSLTRSGQRKLREEAAAWTNSVRAVQAVLRARLAPG